METEQRGRGDERRRRRKEGWRAEGGGWRVKGDSERKTEELGDGGLNEVGTRGTRHWGIGGCYVHMEKEEREGKGLQVG